MEEAATNSSENHDSVKKEAPQLVALLKEMKQGLDTVSAKVQALTAKVKENNFPTADGISYLDTKYLLLLSYCQSLVYYLLRKAKGLAIESHPVTRSLVEIRLFLEKIRPIDKKLEYQIQKLTKDAGRTTAQVGLAGKESETQQESEDPLSYRPNPDMLVSKIDLKSADGSGVYQPPKIAPAIMDEDKMSKQERNALRKQTQTLRRAEHGYVKALIDDMEGRPEEVTETYGAESQELLRYQQKWEERARQEEEHFTRVAFTKKEKKMEKHLKKSRNGLLGLTDGFYDEIKTLPLDDDGGDRVKHSGNGSSFTGKLKKRKRRY